MQFSVLILLLTALVPLIVGFIWYNPKTFGNAWMKAAGVTPESAQKANMAMVFGLTYVLGIFISFTLNSTVIHQNHIFSSLMHDNVFEAGSPAANYASEYMSKYGDRFRTFGHGLLHGMLLGITIALPVIGVNALFEQKGFKYIAINAGFWIVCMGIMGGIICQFT